MRTRNQHPRPPSAGYIPGSDGSSGGQGPDTDQAQFCGCWHTAPYLSSGTCHDARYLLDVDGTFIYGCDETDGLSRMRYAAGNWLIEEDTLYLEIGERMVWVGGQEVAANGSIGKERMIENPTIRIIGYDEPELEAHDITGPICWVVSGT